jgi:hypothetical protein
VTSLLLALLLPAAEAAEPAEPTGPDELYVTSEVLGQGNDESARRMERTLRADPGPLLACRADHLAEAPDALRFLQLDVKLANDGGVKKTKVTSSTGSPAIDACGQALVAAVRYDPPPMFPDRLLVNVTWSQTSAKKP